ncbi:MAG: alpha/beta fold hydrolase [Pseudonocardia sp.]
MLHGLGASADVWAATAAALPGRAWAAPDLPGHGGSARLERYTFAAVAAEVADLVDPAGTVLLGHSFGGVVALHLADRPGVRAVVAVGVKVAWTTEELERAAALAARPARTHPTRDEALARHLKVAGLAGLVEPEAHAAGVVAEGDGWRPALDVRAFAVGEPGVAALLAASPVPVTLARGEHDPMVATAQLRALVADPVELAGVGHNAHVEDPAAVAALVSATGRTP